MTRYISVYRCRLCGKEYVEGGTDTGRTAMNGAIEAALIGTAEAMAFLNFWALRKLTWNTK